MCIAQMICMLCGGEGIFVGEGVLWVGLVGDGGGNAVDGGGSDEVAPVVVVVEDVFGIESGGKMVVGAGEMEGIGVGEEVGEGLVLHVIEERWALSVAMGVCVGIDVVHGFKRRRGAREQVVGECV